ncbi:hypothetical protein SK128_015480 [Halocaridina rubra]|uniref:protein-tyrosine-phosphatase n=1 Tax=Halocaridina rubra TaxID=373956 RepID=A0AAN9ACK0_HALRR
MLPPAVRWLCLLLLTIQGVMGQILSVGDPDAFLLEDLDSIDTTTQPDDTLVGEGPSAGLATELPSDDAGIISLEDAVTVGGDITPETISALEDIISGVGDFGSRLLSKAVEEESGSSNVPQFTRRILVSGTLPSTPLVPEPSPSFTRPSSAVRFLTDPNPGWLPNWPSELLQSTGTTRRPMIRFPSEAEELERTPTIFENVPTSVSLPVIVPSLVVSKVPVTQYFFDLTTVALPEAPGPLYNPDEIDLSGSATSELEDELIRPVIELASSIPELQSSALLHAAESITVTPALPSPGIFPATASLMKDTNTVLDLAAEAPTASISPFATQPISETETVSDEVATENDNLPTVLSGVQDDFEEENAEPQPAQTSPDTPDENDAVEQSTDMPLEDAASDISPANPTVDLPKESTGINVAQPDSSTTFSTPFMIESDIVSSPSTDYATSIKPTSVRPLQAANASRTPLWMLLSKSVPTQTSSTELLHSSTTSPSVSIHTTESQINVLPTNIFTDVPEEVSTDTNLVSSISFNLWSINPHSGLSASVDDTSTNLATKDSDSQLTLSGNTLSTRFQSTTLMFQPSISVSPTTDEISPSVELESGLNFVSLSVPTDNDSAQPSHTIIPTPVTSDVNHTAVTSYEPHVGAQINTTIEYNETPLITTVVERDPLQHESSSTVGVPSPTDDDSWIPVAKPTEKSTSPQSYSSSILTTVTTPLNLVTPELIDGFIPITSETKSIPVTQIDLLPDNANISHTTATSAIVASTAAPAESFSTELEQLPSLTDASIMKESSLMPEGTSPNEHSQSDDSLESSITFRDGLASSNLLLSTTVFPEIKNTPTSVSLIPSFIISATSSVASTGITVLESGLTATNHQSSLLATEISSSMSVLHTNTFSTTIYSSNLSPEHIDISAESSVVSFIPLSTANPTLPGDTPSTLLLPQPSLASDYPYPDLSTLVTPAVITETPDYPTHAPVPDEDQQEAEETGIKEAPTKGTDEGTAEGEVIPDETFTLTSSPAPPSVPSADGMDVSINATESTSSADPTTHATVTITYPTESMPTLTTSVTFPDGTEMVYHLPYLRALVGYNEREFCDHRQNFRAIFAEWISKHLQEETPVQPSEIEFFNKPLCEMTQPSLEDPFNQLPDYEGGFPGSVLEDKMNSTSDNKDMTNVYFYVTSSGKINPNLTENFPLFPMELDISEELIYLRAKVSQLELVRPDGTRDSAPLPEESSMGTTIIVITVVAVLLVILVTALMFFLVVKRKGSSNNYYGRRCTPVSMDAYSMDSVSVYHSFRRKSKRRASGRSVKSYLNQAFDDPNGPSRPLNFAKLTHFISDIDGVHEEFGTIPVNMPKYDELPAGVEDKNRYANVIPVPETRVLLKGMKDSPNSEYINANYVRGPRNESKYYIATQAPLEDTVPDFWRMIWEQETRVVVMLTDFVEKGIDKCADYLPPSETLDCHRLYGDFQVTLKSRDMREEYVVSNVQLKNLENNLVREVAHMWFTAWPSSGVPNEETAFISYILEIRRTRKKLRAKGPILVHCSPGTGRSGTFIACDLVMRQFEEQRSIDVPRTVYSIRRDRAGAVQTKEQYAFIYRVINLYASKLTTGNLDSL